MSQNASFRAICHKAKRQITPKIGQLTASASATAAIITALDACLCDVRTHGPQPYTWSLNHLAKALVKQVEAEVTVKVGSAYPLGRVVVGLLARGHTELGEVLMARLVKKCFWVTAWWPAKLADQTIEQYEKTLGRTPREAKEKGENGTKTAQFESSDQYAVRMAASVALFAAIIQASPLDPPQGPCPAAAIANIPPHFRPSAAWRWLTLVLRAPLVGQETMPLLIAVFLEIAGESLLAAFGRQMHKFCEVLLREGVRANKAGFSDKARSGRTKLLLWLEEWEKTGRAEKVPGKALDP